MSHEENSVASRAAATSVPVVRTKDSSALAMKQAEFTYISLNNLTARA